MAVDKCWNRKVDSLGSPLINVAHLPISWTSSTNGPVIPGTSGFYGNWIKDVRAGQFIVLGDCLVIIITIIMIVVNVVVTDVVNLLVGWQHAAVDWRKSTFSVQVQHPQEVDVKEIAVPTQHAFYSCKRLVPFAGRNPVRQTESLICGVAALLPVAPTR